MHDTEQRVTCPSEEDVVALALDPGGEHVDPAVGEHLSQCDACRAIADGAAQARTALLETPAEPAARDLLPGILEQLPEHAWGTSRCMPGRRMAPPSWIPMNIAAGVLVALGVGLVALNSIDSRTGGAADPADLASRNGVEWLREQQLPEGGWAAAEFGGKPEYVPALNGLALLALARNDDGSESFQRDLHRAAASIVAQQTKGGRIGQEFEGTMYNQGIAALALLEVHALTGDSRLQEPINTALQFIAGRQSQAGGWGYDAKPGASPNTSITAWQMLALMVGDRQGWDVKPGALRRGIAWMTGTVDGRGLFGYERVASTPAGPNNLTMMGAYCLLAAREMGLPVDPDVVSRVERSVAQLAADRPDDYHATFFYASALRAHEAGGFETALVAVTDALVEKQRMSHETGTWLADDQWGDTGGSVYSTSMALLALAGR